MRRIVLWAVVLGGAACFGDNPVSVGLPARLDGEWVMAVDIAAYFEGRCFPTGHFIVRASEPGRIAVATDLGDDCAIQDGEISTAAFSDSIGEFSFTTPNCSVSGRFVGSDSLTGTISCTAPSFTPRTGTWAAGRAGPVTSIRIVPETVAVAVGGTVDVEAVVRDDKGRRLYGRMPVWSLPNDFTAWLTPDGSRVTVRSNNPHAARVLARYHGLEATATVNFSAQRFTQITTG